MPSTAPIGFFDSGMGGLSILKAVRGLLPHENVCYYGDTKNAPYGQREVEEILRLTRAGAQRLLEEGIKALVSGWPRAARSWRWPRRPPSARSATRRCFSSMARA